MSSNTANCVVQSTTANKDDVNINNINKREGQKLDDKSFKPMFSRKIASNKSNKLKTSTCSTSNTNINNSREDKTNNNEKSHNSQRITVIHRRIDPTILKETGLGLRIAKILHQKAQSQKNDEFSAAVDKVAGKRDVISSGFSEKTQRIAEEAPILFPGQKQIAKTQCESLSVPKITITSPPIEYSIKKAELSESQRLEDVKRMLNRKILQRQSKGNIAIDSSVEARTNTTSDSKLIKDLKPPNFSEIICKYSEGSTDSKLEKCFTISVKKEDDIMSKKKNVSSSGKISTPNTAVEVETPNRSRAVLTATAKVSNPLYLTAGNPKISPIKMQISTFSSSAKSTNVGKMPPSPQATNVPPNEITNSLSPDSKTCKPTSPTLQSKRSQIIKPNYQSEDVEVKKQESNEFPIFKRHATEENIGVSLYPSPTSNRLLKAKDHPIVLEDIVLNPSEKIDLKSLRLTRATDIKSRLKPQEEGNVITENKKISNEYFELLFHGEVSSSQAVCDAITTIKTENPIPTKTVLRIPQDHSSNMKLITNDSSVITSDNLKLDFRSPSKPISSHTDFSSKQKITIPKASLLPLSQSQDNKMSFRRKILDFCGIKDKEFVTVEEEIPKTVEIVDEENISIATTTTAVDFIASLALGAIIVPPHTIDGGLSNNSNLMCNSEHLRGNEKCMSNGDFPYANEKIYSQSEETSTQKESVNQTMAVVTKETGENIKVLEKVASDIDNIVTLPSVSDDTIVTREFLGSNPGTSINLMTEDLKFGDTIKCLALVPEVDMNKTLETINKEWRITETFETETGDIEICEALSPDKAHIITSFSENPAQNEIITKNDRKQTCKQYKCLGAIPKEAINKTLQETKKERRIIKELGNQTGDIESSKASSSDIVHTMASVSDKVIIKNNVKKCKQYRCSITNLSTTINVTTENLKFTDTTQCVAFVPGVKMNYIQKTTNILKESDATEAFILKQDVKKIEDNKKEDSNNQHSKDLLQSSTMGSALKRLPNTRKRIGIRNAPINLVTRKRVPVKLSQNETTTADEDSAKTLQNPCIATKLKNSCSVTVFPEVPQPIVKKSLDFNTEKENNCLEVETKVKHKHFEECIGAKETGLVTTQVIGNASEVLKYQQEEISSKNHSSIGISEHTKLGVVSNLEPDKSNMAIPFESNIIIPKEINPLRSYEFMKKFSNLQKDQINLRPQAKKEIVISSDSDNKTITMIPLASKAIVAMEKVAQFQRDQLKEVSSNRPNLINLLDQTQVDAKNNSDPDNMTITAIPLAQQTYVADESVRVEESMSEGTAGDIHGDKQEFIEEKKSKFNIGLSQIDRTAGVSFCKRESQSVSVKELMVKNTTDTAQTTKNVISNANKASPNLMCSNTVENENVTKPPLGYQYESRYHNDTDSDYSADSISTRKRLRHKMRAQRLRSSSESEEKERFSPQFQCDIAENSTTGSELFGFNEQQPSVQQGFSTISSGVSQHEIAKTKILSTKTTPTSSSMKLNSRSSKKYDRIFSPTYLSGNGGGASTTRRNVPFKKRTWELSQQHIQDETDITDDTSPAADDDISMDGGEVRLFKIHTNPISAVGSINIESGEATESKMNPDKNENKNLGIYKSALKKIDLKPEISRNEIYIESAETTSKPNIPKKLSDLTVKSREPHTSSRPSNNLRKRPRIKIPTLPTNDNDLETHKKIPKLGEEAMVAEKPSVVEAIPPSRKRGRPPKNKAILSTIALKNDTNDLKNSSRADSEITQDIEDVEASLDIIPTLKRNIKCGRKPRGNCARNVTVEEVLAGENFQRTPVKQIDEEMESNISKSLVVQGNNTDCSNIIKEDTLKTDVTIEVSATATVMTSKKRGRKPRSSGITPTSHEENDLTSLISNTALTRGRKPRCPGVVAFNPRLLLIRNRSELETDQVLTALDTEDNKGGPLKCGLCLVRITKSKWFKHLSEHYGVGWKHEKEPPIQITSRSCVLAAITAYFKRPEVSTVNCRLCSREYRSPLGLLLHLETCGEKDNRVLCPICEREYSKLSMIQHQRLCREREDRLGEEETNKLVQDMIPSTSSTERHRRVSLIKAKTKLKKLTRDLAESEICFNSTKCIKHDIDMGYYCTMCSTTPAVYFPTETEALGHIKIQHAKEHTEQYMDFEIESSDFDTSNIEEEESEYSSSAANSTLEDDHSDESTKKKSRSRPQSRVLFRPVTNLCTTVYSERAKDIVKFVRGKWSQFVAANFSKTMCYPNLLPSFDNGSSYKMHAILVDNEPSMKFTLADKPKFSKELGTPEEGVQYQTLRRFQSVDFLTSEKLVYMGAPTKTLTWAPLPDSIREQYLVVGCRKDLSTYTRSHNPKIEETLLIVHKITPPETKKDAFKMEIHYAVKIVNGPVQTCAFLPSGGYDEPSNRLGLLAVGTMCSDLAVYALPIEPTIPFTEVKLEAINKVARVIALLPTMTLCLSKNSDTSLKDHSLLVTHCLRICWSSFLHHRHIFASFSNGFIAIWDIKETADEHINLNCFIDNAKRCFTPLNYFFFGEKAVSSFDVHYDTSGPRWLAACGYARKLIVYDIRHLSNPMPLKEEQLKNVARDIDWNPIWESFCVAFCDCIPSHGNSVIAMNPVGLGFVHSKLDNMLCAVSQLHFNPVECVYACGTDNGDLVFINAREMNYEIQSLWRSKRTDLAISILDVKRLDGKELPRTKSNELKEDWIIYEKDYKRKYGLIFGAITRHPPEVRPILMNKKRKPPRNVERYMRINKICWNPNSRSNCFIACGYENGFLRLSYFRRDNFFR